MTQRVNCIICDSHNLEFLYTFKKFPLYMGTTVDNDDKFYDQEWVICKNCGTIQLKNLIDLDELYSVPHNPAVGKTWQKHHQTFAEYAAASAGKKVWL